MDLVFENSYWKYAWEHGIETDSDILYNQIDIYG